MTEQARIDHPVGLSPADALFWYGEKSTPELRPMVAGVLILDRPPDPSRFFRAIGRLTAHAPRLRQRVVEGWLPIGLPRWANDPGFDVDYHVRQVSLPQPGGMDQLFHFASMFLATPLDLLRPLWEVYLIGGVEGGRAAFLFKVHHALADGVGVMALLEALMQPQQPVRPPARRRLGAQGLACGTPQPAGAGNGAAPGGGGRAALSPRSSLGDIARTAWAVGRAVRDLTMPRADDPLAGSSTEVARRLSGLVLPLPRLRRMGEALDATLNDVMLTALAGGLGRYHRQRKLQVDRLRCMVPKNLRGESEEAAVGNRVGMWNISLPTGTRDPLSRLGLVRAQTRTAKGDQRGAAYPFFMYALLFTPIIAMRALTRSAAGRVNLICTNVPGPATQGYLAGAKVDAIYPFAPLMLGAPLSIALLSYADQCAVGITANSSVIPDPAVLQRHLADAVDELEGRASGSSCAANGRGRSALSLPVPRSAGKARRRRVPARPRTESRRARDLTSPPGPRRAARRP